MVETAGVIFASTLCETRINSPLSRCNNRGRNDHNGRMQFCLASTFWTHVDWFRKHIMGLDVSRSSSYWLQLILFRTSSRRLWTLPPISISASLKPQTLLGVWISRIMSYLPSWNVCFSVFESTIRYLGALLSSYELSNQQYPQLVTKAKELADKLAFSWVGVSFSSILFRSCSDASRRTATFLLVTLTSAPIPLTRKPYVLHSFHRILF